MRRLAPLVLVLALAGASLSEGANCVAQAEVEEKISAELTAQVGQEPDDVSCPGDLDAEAGAEMTCTLTAGEETIDVYVTVASVEYGTVNFDIEVAATIN